MKDADHQPAPLRFSTDIKPLFRELDRNSMVKVFDLWNYSDVAEHQDAIVHSLESGAMPCDGTWPAAQVAKIKRWIAEGSQP
ncbi:hypothetical protein [Microbacterium hatanonis]|uniref:Uncharacterized protein n=1 Tax=Microbacterium hatanonis TaxID=404366 RepID=A0A5C8I440_9MICO|nr:hypothetical protein [Microbacterium hatanonis]TXK13079.1 hypothetical protein FVP77_06530 [Microbacterium hatanonis]